MTTVAALFIDRKGPYPLLLGIEHCWDDWRDATTFVGNTSAIVAHPPCQLWTNMAAVNYKRYRKHIPAWKPGGSDGGYFNFAFRAVKRLGGVLEHPAESWAFKGAFPGLQPPRPCPKRSPLTNLGWQYQGACEAGSQWVCEVWQNAYGHKARKRTWLVYVGKRPPFELNWTRNPESTHQCGWQDKRGKARNKPTLGKAEASRTPVEFAKLLIALAKWSQEP